MIIKTQLSEKEMPTKFYNISADLKEPLPPVLHPGRKDPVGPDDLSPLFPYGINWTRSIPRQIY